MGPDEVGDAGLGRDARLVGALPAPRPAPPGFLDKVSVGVALEGGAAYPNHVGGGRRPIDDGGNVPRSREIRYSRR